MALGVVRPLLLRFGLGVLLGGLAGLPSIEAQDADEARSLPQLSEAGRSRADLLEQERLAALGEGRFDDAIETAAELTRLFESLPANWWERLDAERWRDDLRAWSKRPDDERERIAKVFADIQGLFQAPDVTAIEGAIEQQVELLGAESPHVASTYQLLGYGHRRAGRVDLAEVAYRRAIEIQEKVLPDPHPALADSLNMVGFTFFQRAQYRVAEPFFRRAYAIHRATVPENNRAFAVTVNNIGAVLRMQERPREAIPFLRRSLELREQLSGPEHPSLLTPLWNLVTAHAGCREAQKSSEYLERYRALRETLGQPMSKLELAGHSRQLGRRHEAESLIREGLALRKEQGTPDDGQLIESLLLIGRLLIERGALDEAQDALERAREVSLALAGPEHPLTATTLLRLGEVASDRNEFGRAETLIRQGLAVLRRREPLGQGVPLALTALARCMKHRDNWEEAERLYREVVADREQRYGSNHAQTAIAYQELATTVAERGQHDEAIDLLTRTLEIQRRVLGEDPRVNSITTFELAKVHLLADDFDRAESRIRESLAYEARTRTESNANRVWRLHILQRTLREAGRAAEAEEVLREAIALWEEDGSGAAPHAIFVGLADLRGAAGDVAEEVRLYRRAFDLLEQGRTNVLGDERDRARLSTASLLGSIGRRLSCALVRAGEPAEAFSVLERSRSRALLDLLARQERDLEAEAKSDPESATRMAAATRARDNARSALREAERELEQIPFVDAEARRTGLAEVQEARRALDEAEVGVTSELARLYPTAGALDVDRVRARLRDDEIVLCYAWSDRELHLITLPPAGRGEPEAEILARGESAEALTARVWALRQAVTTPSNPDEVESLVNELGPVFLPAAVRARIDRAKRWIVLPEGGLTEIPFSLFTQLGADRDQDATPDIVTASSATVFLDRRQRAASATPKDGAGLVALGAPTFREREETAPLPDAGLLVEAVQPDSAADTAGLEVGDILISYAGAPTPNVEAFRNATQRVGRAIEDGKRPAEEPVEVTRWRHGVIEPVAVSPGRLGVRLGVGRLQDDVHLLTMRRGGDGVIARLSALDQIRLFGGELSPLPGTEREVTQIASLFDASELPAVRLVGSEATLTRLEAALDHARWLHLATHGFTGSRDRPYDAALALAEPDVETVDDFGFLTLAHLIDRWRGRLSHTELVVLSACDTRIGVHRGTGMLSIPWGFYFAGAPTVIASLWKVDDTATALLMGRLYENLLGRTTTPRTVAGTTYPAGRALPKLHALREAQAWLRQADAATVRSALGLTDDDEWSRWLGRYRGRPRVTASPEATTERPDAIFGHPFYWAAFVLSGSPE